MNAPTHIPTKANASEAKTPGSGIAEKSLDSNRCATMIELAVESYRAALLLHLKEKGAPLDAEDLERVSRRILGAPDRPSPVVGWIFGAFEDAIRKTSYEARRVDPFARLIVHTFSHLLAKERDGEAGAGIARSHLPRFLEILRVMLGDDTIAARRALCLRIVEDLKTRHPAEFSWNLFYADSRSREILARTVLDMVDHFRNFDRRVDWFIRFMNSHPHANGEAACGGRHEPFTRTDFFAVARAMIGDIEKELCPVAYGSGADCGTVFRFRDLVERPAVN